MLPQNLVYFKAHYLGKIWFVGLFFLVILLIGFFKSKFDERKFEKQQLRKKQLIIERNNANKNKSL